MCIRVVSHRVVLRIALAMIICASLLGVPNASLLISGLTAQGHNQAARRNERPKPGKPEATLPGLEEIQNESQIEREPAPPVSSTMRSPKLPHQPWNGRRVGDPVPPDGLGQVTGEESKKLLARSDDKALVRPRKSPTRRAHAARNIAAPPTILDDQFIANFFDGALLRTPNGNEPTFWNDQLRVAYAQGQTSLKLAAVELGKTLFESAEYAARNRTDHWYVYDLYKTYLMREPDTSGWAHWESQVPTNGRENVRRAFEEAPEFAGILASIAPNGSATATPASLVSARVDPRNQPGNGLLTRDANWSVSLLSLPGRAGLDLGLGLSYSSMVWTRSGPYIHFDEDNGFPSPGFRLGFPLVQRRVFDAQTGRNSYLFITSAGRRVVLRQLSSSNVYEAGDSSYLQLTDNSPNLVVRSTDGTQLSFVEINNEYRCTEVKDRNGNYITVNHNSLGRITTITDTLGRVITFNYDSNANLISITQAWNGQPAHQWVGFNWGTRNLQPNFSGVKVIGTAQNTSLPVITQVTLNDTSHVTFDYTNSLQVYLIRSFFGTLQRSETTFTYETPADNAPRLLDSRVSAHNWTGLNGVPSQLITTYNVPGDGSYVMTAPDGTIYKEYYGTGWQRGLTTLAEIWSGGIRQKWTTKAWTQDNTSVNYETNPRTIETNVYDAGENRRRKTIDYGDYAAYGLPYLVKEYAADAVTEVRQTYTDYNVSQAYLDRRIIGLISQVHVKNGSQSQSKTTFTHDDPTRLFGVPAAATQHDSNYNLSFTARGNVTAVSQWDMNDINNTTKKLSTYTNYYNTGTPIATIDAGGHQTNILYADSFSDSVNRNTFAYATTTTDADGFSSYFQHNFDFGSTTRTQTPAPVGQAQGLIQTMTYNSLGQLERTTTTNNGAYTRFWYGADYVATYSTINAASDQAYTVKVVDGLGRTIISANNHSGSSGGYAFTHTIYDLMGRVWKQSHPTEVNSSWVPTGDDAAGIYYTQQTYDWQGRPLITTNPDASTRQVSYSGCGCAGGSAITLTDEANRRQKVYSDVFGREVKLEVLNWNGTVYSSRTNTYNARDQVTSVKQYQGLDTSGIYQEIVKTYDGYGRVASHKEPIQTTATTYTYNADGQPLTVTDARGVTQTYTYNNRHLTTTVAYSNSWPLSPVSIAYDAAGNRTSMTDGTGNKTYQYNQLSQLTSETKQISGLAGSFTFSYEYNLAGSLKAVVDHVGSRVDYSFNNAGMLTAVTGSGAHSAPTYASNFVYRAWGGIKGFDFGSGAHQQMNFNSRLRNTSMTLSNGTISATWSFDYYADGKIQKVTDSNEPDFDRAFDYDHVGRLQEARTGAEARGGSTADGPFKQTYGYDVWENTISGTHRLWTESPQGVGATFSNNRNQNWGYDNEGNLTFDSDASYGYDPAGRQGHFNPHVFVGGWPSQHPVQPVLEVSQTFDGNSASVKKTTINRWEEFVGEESQIHESTDTIYYLRSTALGGKVIAQLDHTGYKRLGYIFAGGLQIATQYVWNPGYGFDVAWSTTSPATGSEYMVGGPYLSRKELDPLGADVTNPPQPLLVAEPAFYNPKFEQMLLEIEGGPSEEYQLANQERAILMAATFQALQDRERAEKLWQSGKRTAAMEILQNNPNVGVEYRSLNTQGEILKSGSYFGRAAAELLNNIDKALNAKTLIPQTQASISIAVMDSSFFVGSQEPKFPKVTKEQIDAKIVYGGDQFDRIRDEILAATLHIANHQPCSDAFKQYSLTIPYDVVRSANFKMAGSAVFYQSNAAELLGWTANQVSTERALLERQNNFFRPRYTADFVQPGILTVVFNPSQIKRPQFGGLRAAVTHAFIHLGGQRGASGGNHDLATFSGYGTIIEACK